MVTVDLKVFNDTSSSNGDYYFDLTVKNKTTNGIVAGQQGQTSINQEITFEYEYDKDKRPNYNLTQNQEIAIEYSLFDEDVQSAPNPINNPTELNCTAPSLFTGFSAQYKATVSGECVEITYDKYYGYRGDSGYNLFLRENPSTGTIKEIDYTTYRYASDSQFKPATNYIYYVTKSNVLSNVLLDLWNRLSSKEVAFSNEEKVKLRTISAYASVAVPGPRVVKVSNLKASPGVRSASLTWEYDYDTIEPKVSGFYVRVYSSNGSLYKTYNSTYKSSVRVR